ncbi:MAG: polyphosphate kinase 1, partial [Pandoraea sp.]|nr:polyphosphate kinase 1 [Pandoraea sp.]
MKNSRQSHVFRTVTMNYPLLNRELGILAFNERVLAQAADPATPLLERLRFVCIVSSNLDEFFEIRVAGLKEQMRENPGMLTPDGMTFQQVYTQVCARAQALVEKQYAMFDSLLPCLEAEGIAFHPSGQWNDAQVEWARDYFLRELVPVLTPIGLDPAHPFPRVLNKSLNFAVELEGKDAFGRDAELAIVQAPRALPRLVPMPPGLAPLPNSFVLLSSLMLRFASELFPGLTAKGCHQFRVTRNSDLFVDEDEITNLRTALQGELPARHLGDAVRLEVDAGTPSRLVRRLQTECGLTDSDCYRVKGPVNLVRLMPLPEMVDRPDLKFAPFVPALPKRMSAAPAIFDLIDQGDLLLHHPYDSFQPVLELLLQAARDPDVVAIKQTIYRTGNESALMDALMEAARNGKEVTVVVELLARFDEETNINWAAQLEAVGAHVVYGVVGHKCHAKMLLVVRRTRQGKKTFLKRYVHLGTGNYHPRTARLYTDFGLMTADEALCADVHIVFQQLTGIGRQTQLQGLWQSPFTMHTHLLEAIRHEMPASVASVLADIELPTLDTLADMEIAGVAISHDKLSAFSAELAARSEDIAQRAYAEIGREVNLGSPKQLQDVLFEQLELPKTRKTKTGYSTDAAVLADLQESNPHPFLDLLLQHREATKLRQIIESLDVAIGADGRAHTTYVQTGSQTGRLSSTDPNLQNIPIRNEESHRIRAAFEVGADYETLLTADYSQIEMRIMAHLS